MALALLLAGAVSRAEDAPPKLPRDSQLSPAERALAQAFDVWLIGRYRSCWMYFGPPASPDYVPKIKIEVDPGGRLIEDPMLINPPAASNDRRAADAALAAIKRCHPMTVPQRLKSMTNRWRNRVIRFDLHQ